MFSTKQGTSALFYSSLLFSVGMPLAQAGDTANIKVTATVVNRTCTPGWTGTQDVGLGTIDAATMPAHGTPAASKEFTLSLTGCSSDVSKIKVTASGTPDSADATDFANSLDSAAGGATGVGVFIKGGPSQDTTRHPDKSGSVEYPVSNGAVDMKFKAQLEKDSDTGTVTTGEVNVPVTLNIEYE